MTPIDTASRSINWLIRTIAVLVAAVLSASLAIGLVISLNNERFLQESRLQARASQLSDTVGSSVESIQALERRMSAEFLQTPPNTQSSFEAIMRAMDFYSGVLLALDRKVLAVYPPNPSLIGTTEILEREAVTSSIGGEDYASSVVPSAFDGRPVVSFPVLIEFDSATAIISGSYLANDNPLDRLVAVAGGFASEDTLVIDNRGIVVASNDNTSPVGTSLVQDKPDLYQRAQQEPHGKVAIAGTTYVFATAQVQGTGWMLITKAPTDQVFQTDGTLSPSIRWLAWGLASITLLAALQWVAGLLIQTKFVKETNKRLTAAAYHDALTGLANRRALDQAFARELDQVNIDGAELGVLLIDIDNFKRVNDTYGHDVGDDVLRELGRRLNAVKRSEDLLGRWGGEEFLGLLDNCNSENLGSIAERICQVIAAHPFVVTDHQGNRHELTVTVSVGAVCLTPGMQNHSEKSVLGQLDTALYRAKAAGKNRVELYSDATIPPSSIRG